MDITPSPRILRMLGEIEFAEWQCIAELIDNSIDDFSEIIRSNVPWPGGMKVSVVLPSRHGRLEEAQVVVADTGRGMSRDTLERAVRAGWSSNDRFGKLGLFGMGFNVSTARLGTRTTVLTTCIGDSVRHGVEIDFDSLSDDFEASDLTEEKDDINGHGTTITVSNLKRPQWEWLSRNPSKLREILGRVYSWILDGTSIEIWVNGVMVRPRRHCVWDESRYVNYGSGRNARRIPAIVKIDKTFAEAEACLLCGNWQDVGLEACNSCGSDHLQQRSRRIHGWIGIQRHLSSDFGIDFLRNGRTILQGSKRLFEWINPNDPLSEPRIEYPVELSHMGGRIVGQIHLDHVPVTYSKDSFEYSDRAWKAAVEFLRGPGPILQRSAQALGYSENTSPLALLVQGYRRVDAGRRCLVPGNGDGPIHEVTRDWAKQFWNGAEDYQSDQKWWDAVQFHESEKQRKLLSGAGTETDTAVNAEEVGAALGLDQPLPHQQRPASLHINPPELAVETVQDRINRLDALAVPVPDLSRRIGTSDLGYVDVSTVVVDSDVFDQNGNKTPVWLAPGTGSQAKAYVDRRHALFQRFGITMALAVQLEIANTLRVRASSDLTMSEVVGALSRECFQDSGIDFATVKNQAASVLQEVRAAMSDSIGEDPQRAVEYLTSDEVAHVESGAVTAGHPDIAGLWNDGEFLRFVPPMYLVRLLESWPESFLDGQVFRSSYESLNAASSKRLSLAKVVGILSDVAVVASAEAALTSDQLQRTVWSVRLLGDELSQ